MGTLSNIMVEPCNVSWNGTDIGFTDGNIEIKLEEKFAEIMAHQEGSNLIDMIRTGKNVEMSMTLQETSTAQLTTLLTAGGGTETAVAEVSTVTCSADVAGSLNNKYFLLSNATDAINYYVWFNVNSAGVDPALSGKTGVVVTLATGATASTVATAVAAAVDALAGFTASAASTVVTITNASTGGATDIAAGNSGFTVAVTTQGVGAVPGWGNSKDFTSVLDIAGPLILHPTSRASTDQTRDILFHLAYPVLESLTKSGENPQTVSLTWKILPDLSEDTTRLFRFGNHQ